LWQSGNVPAFFIRCAGLFRSPWQELIVKREFEAEECLSEELGNSVLWLYSPDKHSSAAIPLTIRHIWRPEKCLIDPVNYDFKKLGVKTRWFANVRPDITRKIIWGIEKLFLEERNFLPIIKKESAICASFFGKQFVRQFDRTTELNLPCLCSRLETMSLDRK
jgi:hypothetical protein